MHDTAAPSSPGPVTPTPAPAKPGPWPLPDELTIYTVGELHRLWLDRLASAPADAAPGPVSAGAVDQVDAAGLQLLLSLDSALAQRGSGLVLISPSAVLVDSCTALGLGPWLQSRTQTDAVTSP